MRESRILTDAIKTTSMLADIKIRSNKRFSGGATGALGRTLCTTVSAGGNGETRYDQAQNGLENRSAFLARSL
jgi:hypothetical protein